MGKLSSRGTTHVFEVKEGREHAQVYLYKW